MHSSSRRKGPSVKAGFRALSYSNLESVICSVLSARVSSFLPGTLRAKRVGTKAGKGAWLGLGLRLGLGLGLALRLRLRLRLSAGVRVRVRHEGREGTSIVCSSLVVSKEKAHAMPFQE